VIVTTGTAPANHGVGLFRFEEFATDQVRVLVSLEVRKTQDDRFRIKGGGDGADAMGQLVHKKLNLVIVSSRNLVDLDADIVWQRTISGEGQRMDLHPVGKDELHARQPHAVVRNGRLLESHLWASDVHHNLRAWAGHVADINGVDLKGQLACIDLADLPFSTADGSPLPRFQHLGGSVATHDRRYTQLTRDNRSVAGAPAAVGDDGGSVLHDRLPVRIGDVRHQNLTRLEVSNVGHIGDHTHGTGGDLVTHS